MCVFISRCHYTIGWKSVTPSLWSPFILSLYPRWFCGGLQECLLNRDHSWVDLPFFFFWLTYQRIYLSTCCWDIALKMSAWDLMICVRLLARVWLFQTKTFVGITWFKAPKTVIINSACCLMLACCALDIVILTVWAQWKARQWVKRCIWCVTASSLSTESSKTFPVVMAKVLGRRMSYRGSRGNVVQKMLWRLIPTVAYSDPEGWCVNEHWVTSSPNGSQLKMWLLWIVDIFKFSG